VDPVIGHVFIRIGLQQSCGQSPYPSDDMICWPVSARVGNVKNNDPGLVEPVVLP
jgi:putative SOS response-associated peptidase YedK